MAVCLGQQLAAEGLADPPLGFDSAMFRAGFSFEKRFDHAGIFGGEYRAGGVQQAAAGLQGGPEGFQ